MPRDILTQARLKEVLHYDPDTGVFTRITKSAQRVNIGDVAGFINNAGYRIIGIDSVQYLAHRLAFLYMTGSFPSHDTDHKYGNKADNRWEKIRSATRQKNARNQKIRSTNKSGVNGVYWVERLNKWLASIEVDSKSINLGHHEDFCDAVAARKRADIEYGFDENHGRA